MLVAIADDEIVGTVTFFADGHGLGMAWPPGWSVFRALAVTPHRRSRGAGRALVATRIERAAAVGAEVLGLHTASFMTAAVDLYERAGFRRCTLVRHHARRHLRRRGRRPPAGHRLPP